MNWGIIGLGKIANKFATALKLVESANLYAVASRSQAKADEFAAEYQAKVAYDSYETLFQDENVDVIYIGTPHVFHAESAILAMKNGKSVLCEKPIAMNHAEAKRMFDCAKANHVFLMEAMWTRFIPSFIKAKELVESGAIGEVKNIIADFGFRAEAAADSRVFNPNLGGGSILDIGIYPIFLAISILGKPKNIKAIANLNEQKTDDSCGMLFDYGNAMANLNSTFLANQKIEATIFGTTGAIQLNNRFHEPTSVSIFREKVLEETLEFEELGSGMQHQIFEVEKCLKAGKIESEMMSWSDSLLLHEVIDWVRMDAGIYYPQDSNTISV
jgi:predicted dehydrogenase